MSFIEGEPLDKRIERGPLKLEDALDIAQQIAKGLEAAHEKGVVHRDIKPQNVMVDAKGHATIMDFGLALLTKTSRLTKADQTMGTVAYMSPEEAQGMEVDQRSVERGAVRNGSWAAAVSRRRVAERRFVRRYSTF